MNKNIITVEKTDDELKVKLNGSVKDVTVAMGGMIKIMAERLGINAVAFAAIAEEAYSEYENEQRVIRYDRKFK